MQHPQIIALGQALQQASAVPAGVAIANVDRIEASWFRVEGGFAFYGFVVRLTDGGRRYLGLELDESRVGAEPSLDILILKNDAGLPDVEGVEWDRNPSHLNRRLTELKLQ